MDQTDDMLDQIAAYLRGQKVPTRSTDPRMFADHIDQVIRPQLQELAQLKAKKGKEK